MCGDSGPSGGLRYRFGAPPTAVVGGGVPLCVVPVVSGAMNGSLDAQSGDLDLVVPLRMRIHYGLGLDSPCPLCIDGLCDGGPRDGLTCSVDATDHTFGSVSYDCPPALASNISGAGFGTSVEYTTGSLSIPFGTGRCDDSSLTMCSSNSDCTGIDVGTCLAPACDSKGNGPDREPNGCDDLTCTPDGGDPGDGTCLAGPVDSFCDGFLRSNGDGFMPCISNADCDVFVTSSSDPGLWVCPNDDCGSCSLDKNRDCFLDPIASAGEPGVSVVAAGCIGTTSNGGPNAALGLPGAMRVRQNLQTDRICADGVTAFVAPGGSNCP